MKHILKLAVVALLATGVVSAQKPARKAARNQILQALNLSQDQKAQTKAIFQSAVQSGKPVAQQMKQNREELAAAVTGNDAAKIQQLSTQQGQLRGQILEIRSGAMAKFLGILTPAQRIAAEQARLTFKDLLGKRLGAG
jgi:Spy/CpxP family protein refolding chaperone